MTRSGGQPGYHPEFVKKDGDHDRDEELKETFDPEMDDPEAPGVHHGEVAGAAEEHGRKIKQGNGQGSKEKEVGDLAFFRILSGRSDSSDHQDEPEDQSDGKKNLPGPSKVKIFPSLMAEPEPEVSKKLIDPEHFAQQASDGDNDQGKKEEIDSLYLTFGFLSSQGD